MPALTNTQACRKKSLAVMTPVHVFSKFLKNYFFRNLYERSFEKIRIYKSFLTRIISLNIFTENLQKYSYKIGVLELYKF
jgi:hypothetical protein